MGAPTWITNCEICTDGLLNQIDEYKSEGMSERKAAKQMEYDCNGQWKAETIRERYRYHAKGKRSGSGKKSGGGIPPSLSDEAVLRSEGEIISLYERLRDLRYQKAQQEYEELRRAELEQYKDRIPNWDDLDDDGRQQAAWKLDEDDQWAEDIPGYHEMSEPAKEKARSAYRQEQAKEAENNYWRSRYSQWDNFSDKQKEGAKEYERKSEQAAYDSYFRDLQDEEATYSTDDPAVEFIVGAVKLVPAEIIHAITKRIYHTIASVLHPDKGGNVEAMQKLNALYEKFETQGIEYQEAA